MSKLRELLSKATPGPWFVRRCDDDDHMCMTVISNKDYGPFNNSQYDSEADTVAITFHQCLPAVAAERDDFGDADTALIVYLRNHAEAIAGLIEAAERFRDDYKAGRSTKTGAKYALFSALSALKD